MSDALLRELERRWVRSGSAQDGEAFLRAALRAGRLAPERLALAAHLGDPSARALAPEATSPPSAAGEPLARWVEGVASYGLAAARRAGLAVVRLALPEWERHSAYLAPRWRAVTARGRPRIDPRPGELVRALEGWLLAPEDAARAEALRRARGEAAEVILLRTSSVRGRAALDAVRALLLAADGECGPATRAAEDLLYPDPAARVRAALAREVVPWALGLADPLAPRR